MLSLALLVVIDDTVKSTSDDFNQPDLIPSRR